MENRINIGEMDTRVEVQECLIERGEVGEKVKYFASFARPFAKVERMTSESVENGNLDEGQRLTLTMYKIPEMTTRWRILVNGTPYEITSIDPVSRVSPLCLVTLSAIEL